MGPQGPTGPRGPPGMVGDILLLFTTKTITFLVFIFDSIKYNYVFPC